MNDQQSEFLRRHVVCGDSYAAISKDLNIHSSIFSKWYEELRTERERIAKIRTVWGRKKFTPRFEEFFIWFEKLERKCGYCEITETEIERLLTNGKPLTKRIATRGRRLEFDRKDPDLNYDNLDNIVLCCYWCNNAKTDTFTYEEFLEVGKVFKSIWQQRLAQ